MPEMNGHTMDIEKVVNTGNLVLYLDVRLRLPIVLKYEVFSKIGEGKCKEYIFYHTYNF